MRLYTNFFWITYLRGWTCVCLQQRRTETKRPLRPSIQKNSRGSLNSSKRPLFWHFWHFLTFLTFFDKIFSFLESASNLQSEKVPYRYIRKLQFFTFIWEFSIFKASGLSTNLKKKIKYAEIDFTSHHSFLRVRSTKL
jgi:hypothetical protein